MISRVAPGAAAAWSPPAAVPGRGRGWYRIDLHVHTDLSVGADLTPEQVVAEVLAAGLDGFASTEHNTAAGHGRWATAGTDLLVILGQEVVTGTGHWLALGVEPGQVIGSDYRARDAVVSGHVQQVRDNGGLCVAAHPFAPYPGGLFGFSYSQFDAVEVWNGRWSSDLAWQADNETALADWGRQLIADVEHRQRVYPIDELDDALSRYGMPDDQAIADYAGHQKNPVDRYIEIRLWSDAPVRHLIDSRPIT